MHIFINVFDKAYLYLQGDIHPSQEWSDDAQFHLHLSDSVEFLGKKEVFQVL